MLFLENYCMHLRHPIHVTHHMTCGSVNIEWDFSVHSTIPPFPLPHPENTLPEQNMPLGPSITPRYLALLIPISSCLTVPIASLFLCPYVYKSLFIAKEGYVWWHNPFIHRGVAYTVVTATTASPQTEREEESVESAKNDVDLRNDDHYGNGDHNGRKV